MIFAEVTYLSTSLPYYKMNTRKIAYIESDEDTLQKEVDWAIENSFEERLQLFYNHLRVIYMFAGIDLENFSGKKSIYYISENDN